MPSTYAILSSCYIFLTLEIVFSRDVFVLEMLLTFLVLHSFFFKKCVSFLVKCVDQLIPGAIGTCGLFFAVSCTLLVKLSGLFYRQWLHRLFFRFVFSVACSLTVSSGWSRCSTSSMLLLLACWFVAPYFRSLPLKIKKTWIC